MTDVSITLRLTLDTDASTVLAEALARAITSNADSRDFLLARMTQITGDIAAMSQTISERITAATASITADLQQVRDAIVNLQLSAGSVVTEAQADALSAVAATLDEATNSLAAMTTPPAPEPAPEPV